MFYRQSFVAVPGPGNTVTPILAPDPKRVVLIIGQDPSLANAFGIRSDMAPFEGIYNAVGNYPLVISLREWGPLVQAGWFARNLTGFASSCTIIETLSEIPYEVTLETLGVTAQNGNPPAFLRQTNDLYKFEAGLGVPSARERGVEFERIRREIWTKLSRSRPSPGRSP